ncbi:McrB family protein [Tengunoibacter tsumagoiensis]|uniref:ATPase dynein-related AAA domain-containing protein n=1 Tax=Tengunoibacter tsumagoiensis TaxID=2014871 RepID=A0A402A672_9CHLR|nr:hypothetical protein [Tengunoibacter tsumagoiensis]GCE14589.1 hypothetical protein KTT_44480 [Tengunoibacter tsumagoiensis]
MNAYLLPTSSSELSIKKNYALKARYTIGISRDDDLPVQVDDMIYLFQTTENALLPYQFTVSSINRDATTFVISVSKTYRNALLLDGLRPVWVIGQVGRLNPQPIQEWVNGQSPLHPIHLTSLQIGMLEQLLDISSFILSDSSPSSEAQAVIQKASQFFDRIAAQLQNMQQLTQQQHQENLTQNEALSHFANTFSDRALAVLFDIAKALSSQNETLSRLVATYEGTTPARLVQENEEPYQPVIEFEHEEPSALEDWPEDDVLDLVKTHIHERGFYFEDEQILNYHICLKTRPFVILSGLSGTGKSRLAQLYMEALGQGEKQFERLAVRPNWNDDRYLLGQLNTFTGEYLVEPALAFILEAIQHPSRLYSLCLDEMNLAHVEYYFSQFLSAMEEEQPAKRRIKLFTDQTFQQLQRSGKHPGVPAEIHLPANLLITGTINVDETTQPISDKVIDRANTIEFFHVDLDRLPTGPAPEASEQASEPLLVPQRIWQSYRATQPDPGYRPLIKEISALLQKAQLGLGYRTVREIELYLANSKGLLKPQDAFDLQCKQRILPRIRGGQNIESTLTNLSDLCKANGLSRTQQRLQEMKDRLKSDGYTTFWR